MKGNSSFSQLAWYLLYEGTGHRQKKHDKILQGKTHQTKKPKVKKYIFLILRQKIPSLKETQDKTPQHKIFQILVLLSFDAAISALPTPRLPLIL